MVQITPDSMLALKQAIKDMHDYPINCGVLGAARPDETVIVQWTDDDKNVNIGYAWLVFCLEIAISTWIRSYIIKSCYVSTMNQYMYLLVCLLTLTL